jgi:hypothetical protein
MKLTRPIPKPIEKVCHSERNEESLTLCERDFFGEIDGDVSLHSR